jgi:nucleoside-diphosphate-sugar epimerase
MFGTGDESRDYIFIEDLVEALSLVAFGVKGKDYIFNIANGEEHTIKEVAEAFAEEEGLDKVAVSFNGVALEGSPKCWRADVSRLKELGYYPKVGIGEGIHRYVEWVEGLTNEHN